MVAALHLLESLAKNVVAVRSKALPQVQGVEQVARLLLEADSEEVASAAADCLEEVCRGVPSSLAAALAVLGSSSISDALRRKETALQHGAAAPAARKRARAGARAADEADE